MDESREAIAEARANLDKRLIIVAILLFPLVPFFLIYTSRRFSKTARGIMIACYFVFITGAYQFACLQSGPVVKRINVEETKIIMKVGETSQISYQVEPASSKITASSFESNHEDIATISGSGVVTAMVPGRAKITISVTDNHYTTRTKTVKIAVVE